MELKSVFRVVVRLGDLLTLQDLREKTINKRKNKRDARRKTLFSSTTGDVFSDCLTLRRSIIVPRGANNEYGDGPGGPGTGFCSPGGVFLVLVAVVAYHYIYTEMLSIREHRSSTCICTDTM